MPKPASDPDQRYLAGRNPVREALERSESVEKVLLSAAVTGRLAAEIREQCRDAGVPLQTVPPEKLERLVPGVNHQGVVAVVAAVGYADFDEMLRSVAADHETVAREKPVIVLLDGIQDPHNLGAILRSAVAAGARGVVIPERGAAPLNAAALKTSAGTARRIPVSRVGNLREALLQLKERGYWIAGADGEGDVSVWEMDWDRPIGLVIGSEDRGMRQGVADQCDYRVSIPMAGPAESLNASVAAGILLFAAARARTGRP
jgi:23S rRNA (guanosine2251-2'-O)-methyltransferase